MKNIYYSNDFTPHFPVGGSIICRAKTEVDAIALFQKALQDHGLVFDGTIQMMDENTDVVVLDDGDY